MSYLNCIQSIMGFGGLVNRYWLEGKLNYRLKEFVNGCRIQMRLCIMQH